MKKFFGIITVLLAVVLIFMPLTVLAAEGNGAYVKAAYDMINNMYKGNIDNAEVYEKIIKNMFNSLDEYTEYYDLEQAEILFQRLENSVDGIGVMMTDISGGITIVEFLDSSPARDAGLMTGDIIVSVDGLNVAGMTAEQASKYIKGQAGTSVKIGVKRGAGTEILFYNIVRASIKISPVIYKIIDGNIAYIKITTFSFNADVDFDAVMNIVNNMGIKKIILDLRNNGGGSVQAAVNVAKHFIPEGIITTLDFEDENAQDIVYTSSLKENPYDLVVLINEFTASSSELVAGAVRDTLCGYVIGERTYGKSVFQQIFPIIDYEAFEICYEATGIPLINYYDLLGYGIYVPEQYIMGYVKMTVGEYLTPIGRKINNVGVRPMKLILNQKIINDVYIEGLSELYCIRAYNRGDSGSEILRAKYILKALGYYTTIENDVMDQIMIDALKRYCNDKGLTVSDTFDIQTQKTINKELTDIQYKADKQFLKAIDILEN